MFKSIRNAWVKFWFGTPEEQRKLTDQDEYERIEKLLREYCSKNPPGKGHKLHVWMVRGSVFQCIFCNKTFPVPKIKLPLCYGSDVDSKWNCDHHWVVLDKHHLECTKCFDIKLR